LKRHINHASGIILAVFCSLTAFLNALIKEGSLNAELFLPGSNIFNSCELSGKGVINITNISILFHRKFNA
jgi:hypothetical protein